MFDAITTLDGLRRWWTAIVTGSADPGGTLCFGLAGLDEQIVMRVRFGLADRGPQACELNFRIPEGRWTVRSPAARL